MLDTVIADAEKLAASAVAARPRNRPRHLRPGARWWSRRSSAILAGGHALLIGVPGLGKTLLVDTLGRVLGLDRRRIQFTPDLMPADITGSEVLDDEAGRRSFRFVPGPVFCQLLMADEINRASPRTQSALLQAMQEQARRGQRRRACAAGAVPCAGDAKPAGAGRHLSAAGGAAGPFLLSIEIGYPDEQAERAMLLATTGSQVTEAQPVMDAAGLMRAQALVRAVPVGEKMVDAILALVRGARPETASDEIVRRHVAWGPGPRAAQALMLATRARALLDGRLSPSLDDVAALAQPVLRHRMALNFSARAEGVVLSELIDRLVGALG